MQGMGEKKMQSVYMDVSKNSGTPKSSIFIGFSIIHHPFWDTPIFGNTHIEPQMTHLLKDLTHKMEGQPPTLPPQKKSEPKVSWVVGVYIDILCQCTRGKDLIGSPLSQVET